MTDLNNENTSAAPADSPKVRAAGGQSWAIPAAIIIGFGLIAASIYFSGSKAPSNQLGQGLQPEEEVANLEAINPVTEADHIRGNPNAKLVIVEYSDFDCPFCKTFHTTMQRIMDEYGAGGNVAWVYRHFPLTSLHPSAAHIAEASECVADLGGDEAFWKFADLVFGERGTNEPTNIARLSEFAEIAGVSTADYQSCMDSDRMVANVEDDVENAIATGGRGTPHSIIVVGDQLLPINGAQPYETVKQMIDGLLR